MKISSDNKTIVGEILSLEYEYLVLDRVVFQDEVFSIRTPVRSKVFSIRTLISDVSGTETLWANWHKLAIKVERSRCLNFN